MTLACNSMSSRSKLGLPRVGYRYLLGACFLLGVLYVWMGLHMTSKPLVHQSTSGLDLHVANSKPVPKRSHCGLEFPFLVNLTASCQLKLPLPDSCALAKQLFTVNTKTCSGNPVVDYCSVAGEEVTCNTRGGRVIAEYFNISTGLIHSKQYSTSPQLSLALQNLRLLSDYSGYVFLRKVEDKLNHGQLLVLFPIKKTTPKVQTGNDIININTLFVDSVSYFHFHRSLPKVIKALESVKSRSTKVLSYPLYQSLKSRTYENMQALFSGEVNTDVFFSTQAMPTKALDLQVLLKPLRDKGYDNLVMEDLCWHWEWGFSKDLLVHNKSLTKDEYWRNLLKAFDRAAVTNYGISPSSCKILSANGHPDPFHGIPAVCYNNKYQHSYIFDYLNQYQQFMYRSGAPYTSFFSCNTAHDEWGTRVKTLDDDLADHMLSVSNQSNTLTILLSDHGNNYGDFPQQHQQGRDEAYHPLLFIIIPEAVQRVLGDTIMTNLERNQARLVTVLDVHYLLKHIATPSKSLQGIISSISAGRSCEELPLFEPNICICAEQEQVELSFSELNLLAEYASGFLTNKLSEAVNGVSEMKCNVLLPVSYDNVHSVLLKNGQVLVTMNINYPSPLKDVAKETILVTTTYTPQANKNHNIQATVKAFERVSTYSVYRSCGDGPTTETLCICDKHSYYYNKAHNWLIESSDDQLLASRQESHKISRCIYVIQRFIGQHGFSLYAVNVCEIDNSLLKVKVKHKPGLYYSAVPQDSWLLRSLDVRFLMIVRLSDDLQWNSLFHFSI